jgi:hypothetical protein
MMRIMTLMNTMNSFDMKGRLMRFSNSVLVEHGSLGPCDHMYIPLLCDYINAGMLNGYSTDTSVAVYCGLLCSWEPDRGLFSQYNEIQVIRNITTPLRSRCSACYN